MAPGPIRAAPRRLTESGVSLVGALARVYLPSGCVARDPAELGEVAPGGRRAFPSPAAMASAGDAFYRDVARAGYRGRYLLRLSADVAAGSMDLEELRDPGLADDGALRRLRALPGVGPYAAAHVMLTSLGRYRQLILDSWTRPTYAKIAGRATSDRTIERRFRRYRDYAGLAFWLVLTEDWVDD